MTPIWGYSGNAASLVSDTVRCPLMALSGHHSDLATLALVPSAKGGHSCRQLFLWLHDTDARNHDHSEDDNERNACERVHGNPSGGGLRAQAVADPWPFTIVSVLAGQLRMFT